MRAHLLATTTIIGTCCVFLSAADMPKPGSDWPQFRGISALGTAEGFATPTDRTLSRTRTSAGRRGCQASGSRAR